MQRALTALALGAGALAAGIALGLLVFGGRPHRSAPDRAAAFGAVATAAASPSADSTRMEAAPERPREDRPQEVARLPGPPAAAPAQPQDEASLMKELRAMRQSDPELSLRLAREGNERFPGSADAAERAAIVVKSLMRMGRAQEAMAEARAMVDRYAGTEWALDVKHHMLDIPSYEPDAG
jgi:hypothetical protein